MWLNVVLTSVFFCFVFLKRGTGVGEGEVGGGYSAKRRSDPEVANPEVKIQVRDLVQVVDIVDLFAGRGGAIFGENSFYRVQEGKWAQETCVGSPQQRYAMRVPGRVQERDHVGIIEGSCGYLASEVSIRGKLVYRETRSTRLGGSTCGSTQFWPPGSLSRSQSSGTGPTGASCGYCCPLFPHRD